MSAISKFIQYLSVVCALLFDKIIKSIRLYKFFMLMLIILNLKINLN